jgi:tetratricopeptide (TPR) repeat protein
MRKNLLILIAFFLLANAHAQTREIDSLKQLLQKQKTDTGRVLLLAELAYLIFESKPDTAMTLAMQGLELSRKIHYEKGEAACLHKIGAVYSVLGNYSKTMTNAYQALHINEKIGNLDGQRACLNTIGVIYREQGDSRSALDYFFKAKDIATRIDDKKGLCVALINISHVYKNLKIYDSATLFAQQAYNIATQINYARTAGLALQYLGDIHLQTKQYNLALEYLRLSFSSCIAAGSYLQLSTSYLTTANAFDSLGNKDSVLFYGKAAFNVAKEGGFTSEMRDAARLLSHYYRNYNADSAFYYQDVAKAMNDTLFSQERQRDIQSLQFDERMRQQEIEAKKLQEQEERKHNLQYAAIAVALITFVILFFLFSRSVVVGDKFIRFFGILGLLAVFEFINLFIHPHLAHLTNDSPVLMLFILMCIAALLIPLHHKLEHWIIHRLVEKNNKIRLAAAKKTIERLEKSADAQQQL